MPREAVIGLTPEETSAVLLSLRVALWAVACSLPPALAVAYVLARKSFIGRSLLDALVHLPLILPPVVTGYLLLVLFGRHGLLGEFLERRVGLVFAFRWTGAALAAAVMGFPLLVRAIRLSLETIDRRLEEAAATLGAPPLLAFATVVLPLIAPGILTGAILAFARAMGEFGATITFVSDIPGETETLPVAIYAFLQTPGGDAGAIRLTIISLILSVGALLLSEALARRLDKSIGRV
jgi:molybdate transport system permease protein